MSTSEATMRIGFVFPGQAAQRPGMASAWAGTPHHAVFHRVGDRAGVPLVRLADDAEACAASTALAQPAIHAASMAAFDALVDAGIRPDVVAGHSLGEVTAAVAAGVVDRTAGADLVAARGDAMGRACASSPGAMAAIVRLELAEVETLVRRVDDVVVANANAPGQTVVAGVPDAVGRVGELAAEAGGRVLSLKVEGAFHTPAMSPALVVLDTLLARTRLSDPAVPLVSGIDARPRTTADGVVRALVDGILAPVRWIDVQRALVPEVDLLVEVGPGGVLAGCAKRTIPGVAFRSVASPGDVNAVVDLLAELGEPVVAPAAVDLVDAHA